MAQCEARFDCCQWVRITPRAARTQQRDGAAAPTQLALPLSPPPRSVAVQQVNYFLHSGHLPDRGPQDVEVAQELRAHGSRRRRATPSSSGATYAPSPPPPGRAPRRGRSASSSSSTATTSRWSTARTQCPPPSTSSVASRPFDSNLAARLADAAAADAAAAVGAAPPARAQVGRRGARVAGGVRREARHRCHAALLNAVDTPAALKALEQLVRAANTFVAEVPDA